MIDNTNHTDTSKPENNKPEIPGLILCKDNGTEYMIPPATEPAHAFKTAELLIDNVDVMSASAGCKIYIHTHTDDTLFYALFEHVLSRKEDRTDEEVTLLLYKTGESRPLAASSQSPYDGELLFDLKEIIKEPASGRYFILLNNLLPETPDSRFDVLGGHTRFSFSILPDGAAIEHPVLRRFKLEHPRKIKNHTVPVYVSGEMYFSFTWNRPVGEMEEYRVTCYNKDLLLMGKECFAENRSHAQSRKSGLTLTSPYIWMPDSYFCILEHNGEPFYKINFEITDTSGILSSGDYIKKNTPDYILPKYLEQNNAHWKRVRETNGFTAIKYKITELYRQNILNNLRRQYHLNTIEFKKHFLFIGKETPDTETILHDFAYLACDLSDFKYIDCARLAEPKNTPNPYEETSTLLNDCSRSVICLHNPSSLLSGNINLILQLFEQKLRSRNDWALLLAGTESEITLVLEAYPELEYYFPPENRIRTEDTRLVEIVHGLQKKLAAQSLSLSPEAENKLVKALTEQNKQGKTARRDADSIRNLIEDGILPRFQKRILESGDTRKEEICLRYLSIIEAEDIDTALIGRDDFFFEESIRNLNTMVGLSNVKRNILTTFNRVKFNTLRRDMGFSSAENGSQHMIFTGNPGTGKTTVAKMVGKIYRSMGLLSKGEVIVTERSRMVGRYIGETEKNMQSLLAQARGNVLFVDEAYTLCDTGEDRKDFGYRAVECLLTILAQKNPDMLIILAGYENDMKRMLQVNQGLRGRFPYIFHFEDYSAEELMQIAKNLLEKEQYKLTRGAEDYLRFTIEESLAQKDVTFSNARFIEQYITNGIIPAMADRLINGNTGFNRDACRLIEPDDIETAYPKFRSSSGNVVIQHPKIGFRA